MNDWIGLGFILLILLSGFFALLRLAKPYEVSKEEYEKRLKNGTGSLGVAAMGLQKILQPQLEKAVIAQQDLRSTQLRKAKESGDVDDPDNENDDVDSATRKQGNTSEKLS